MKPQASWNYQIGSSYQTGPLTVSADAYYIYFGNLLKHESINGNTIFTNGGGAIYQGIEAEATYIVGWVASVFANASLNSAKFTSSGTNPGSNVSDSPKDTASLGVLYDKNAIQASLLGRFIGTRYGDATDAGGVNNIGLDPYFTMDASLGYTFGGEGEIVPAPTTVRLQVVNLTDNTKIYSNNGTGADGVTPTFYTIPGRSFFASLSAKF